MNVFVDARPLERDTRRRATVTITEGLNSRSAPPKTIPVGRAGFLRDIEERSEG
jgi:hypothetical protein